MQVSTLFPFNRLHLNGEETYSRLTDTSRLVLESLKLALLVDALPTKLSLKRMLLVLLNEFVLPIQILPG